MTEQTRPQLTDALIERMLIERAGPGAPADLVGAIATAVESTGQRASGLLGALSGPAASRTRRGPRRTWLLVAATLLVGTGVIGASLIGDHLVAPVPVPTMPVAVTSPTTVPSAGPSASVVPYRAASWTATGSMIEARQGGIATLLLDGKVLVAGGLGKQDGPGGVRSPLATAELYDPGSGSWTATGNMVTLRQGSTATLLPDGRVLVAGGDNGNGTSAELYDPGTRTWTATGSMVTPRAGHTATLLPDGKVLVAGGYVANDSFASAELYDPGSGTWTATGSMATGRRYHTATLLRDGKVLVAGGFGNVANVDILASAELYDPGTGRWSATGSMTGPRVYHKATLLAGGEVLVTSGMNGNESGLATADLYDPGRGTWTATRKMVSPGQVDSVTLLPDGRVLVAGGANGRSAELYDPGTRTWTATGSMTTPRSDYTATLLPDGMVLVAGGNFTGAADSAELYEPGSGG